MIKIEINGKEYISQSGHEVTVIDGVVRVDGKTVETSGNATGVVRVDITGDLVNLKTDASATISGGVKGDVGAGGSVQCGNVAGSVDAGGSVQCNNVGKNVDAGGSVTCGTVGGDIDAGGSVRHN